MDIMDRVRNKVCLQRGITEEEFYILKRRIYSEARRQFSIECRDLWYTFERIWDYIWVHHANIVYYLNTQRLNRKDIEYIESIPDCTRS